MRKLVFLILLALLTFDAIAADGFPEPFGLSWGMSESSLIRLGFVRSASESGPIHMYSSKTVPSPWSKGESYLALTYNNRLIKVVAVSTDFTDDIDGSEGKAAYAQLNGILTNKYGKPSDHVETSGQELYKEYDEFYQCLKYAGCGAYATIYKIAGGAIGVELDGESRGAGYLKVTYESPAFAAAKQEIKSRLTVSDSDAL